MSVFSFDPNRLETARQASSVPTRLETVRQDLFVEPLKGPAHIESLLSTFPDEVYDKSPSSKFYKFFQSLLGPSGVGSIVQNYFQARLLLLEYNIELFDIERFYGDPFKFGRIFEEQVYDNVDEALLPQNWERVKAKDASYRNRALDFMGAVRLGSSPQGMKLAAKSGIGSDVEVIERYKWLFDQMSDQPIGIKSYGSTFSLNEFVVIPRASSGSSEIQRLKFEATTDEGEYILSFMGYRTDPISHLASDVDVQQALRLLPPIGEDGVEVNGGPLPFPFTIRFIGPLANEDVQTIRVESSTLRDINGRLTKTQVSTEQDGVRPIDAVTKIPERLLHNMQSALDRLRPVNSFFTFDKAQGTVLNRPYEVFASSSYKEPVRFVTGNLQVKWPPLDSKYWIQAGVEKSSKRMYQTDSAHYINFHPIAFIQVVNNSILDEALMLDSNPDFKGFLKNQVQGAYPPEYSVLSGVTQPTAPTTWTSAERKAPENEVIEVDFGQARPVNFLFFDVTQVPIDVKIEYSVWDNSSEKVFKEVLYADPAFSGFIDSNEPKRWHNIACQFTNVNGEVPVSRYLRIHLQRLETENPFAISVRSLKAGRNVML